METNSILGLSFFVGGIEGALRETLKGALVIAPSGPNLANELRNLPAYRAAVQEADVTLTDSAVMVAVYAAVTGKRVPRHSGLKFVEAIVGCEELKAPGAMFWIMPSQEECDAIGRWLRTQGFEVNAENSYVAPFYPKGAIEDALLLERLREYRPRVVMINLAGGKQEVLGAWLKSQLTPSPGLVCTGAAIAFLAGTQASIPTWADRAGLGWLFRCFADPLKFVPRYWQALPLLPLVWRYREKMPPAI
ncbi:UDP-N-acetyl-D-mannosaminuronic acid transferase (WecB/TagA/CpsF family) [Prosthecobacter fusiformis]|uniref:UDP-N-acetyl-D-mannosaminuronic acid transferase (WecB/TagA/CpsF family) n=1 Tax=Prosthecobacter fusiformis TaxID=48464 RepID=A0A4R7S2E2_9BACT|nr:WecB/TagA/CpsF family glycosyltransferase [Prosthecobacter fusiformis]TDU71425.1 UDP-N-acetyl-D-mannosaminuronic acid transferase (WecB/TagA/CpsF family) [Prosthecobacter fusiformis]